MLGVVSRDLLFLYWNIGREDDRGVACGHGSVCWSRPESSKEMGTARLKEFVYPHPGDIAVVVAWARQSLMRCNQ